MKRILITGANSFIGTSFEKYLAQWPEKYHVDTVDMIGDAWREKDFSEYDVVYHVAGIAHFGNDEVCGELEKLCYAVNTALAVETAEKAKTEGVKQFVFLSSASVYGEGAPIGKERVITKETPLTPVNFYGNSKMQAEKGILRLADERFKVVILRPPMIYGPGCKGNYPTLSKLARKVPVFPKINNRRSMLYIGNLVEFVRLIVDNEEQGTFWPQNAEYSNTIRMVEMIAKAHGKKVAVIPGFTWVMKLMSHMTDRVSKAFGSLCYEQGMSEYKEKYCLFSLEESIQITESCEL